MIRRAILTFALLLTAGLAALAVLRWDTWFYNPEEAPYSVPKEPVRLLLTFGNDGEESRYVSWMCDTTLHKDARLILADDTDTTAIDAQGEVFVSRAGKACYYRAEIKGLKPNHDYSYCAETNGHRSAWHHFHTYNPKAESFSFLYMGDVQDTINGIANRLLRSAIKRHPEVEFVAFGGDLTERPTDAYWGETFRSIDSICTAMPILNITGNHDYFKGVFKSTERRFALYFPYFLKGMEERNDENHLYHLRYHNTDLYLLDSDRGAPYLWQQKEWLSGQFEASTATHRIVMLHHPLYSIKHEDNNIIQRWVFNDVIREANVKLVLQGHEHAYAHCTDAKEPLKSHDCKNPPLYTVSHCSPKNYSIHPTERFHPVHNDSRYYQIIRVNAKSVTMLGYDATTGERIDSVRIASK